MLYQLSYASALKPSKNSRRGTKIARAPYQISSTSLAKTVENQPLGDLTITYILSGFYGLAYKRPCREEPNEQTPLDAVDRRNLARWLPCWIGCVLALARCWCRHARCSAFGHAAGCQYGTIRRFSRVAARAICRRAP